MSAPAGCENCRKTERNLARAIGIIEKMLAAERALTDAQNDVTMYGVALKQQHVNAARWLEELT